MRVNVRELQKLNGMIRYSLVNLGSPGSESFCDIEFLCRPSQGMQTLSLSVSSRIWTKRLQVERSVLSHTHAQTATTPTTLQYTTS